MTADLAGKKNGPISAVKGETCLTRYYYPLDRGKNVLGYYHHLDRDNNILGQYYPRMVWVIMSKDIITPLGQGGNNFRG